jgi:hypothetical protein
MSSIRNQAKSNNVVFPKTIAINHLIKKAISDHALTFAHSRHSWLTATKKTKHLARDTAAP